VRSSFFNAIDKIYYTVKLINTAFAYVRILYTDNPFLLYTSPKKTSLIERGMRPIYILRHTTERMVTVASKYSLMQFWMMHSYLQELSWTVQDQKVILK
jgi:hypothetical protein